MKAKYNPDVCHKARIAAEQWFQHFKINIDLYHQMHTFVLGRQWENNEEEMLLKNSKVPLQFNKLGTLINTLLGEQQQNTPMLEVVPLSGCDEETASLRQTLVKDMVLSTDAKTVYQIAAKQAFVGGFGAYLVDTDYMHEESFEQKIVFRSFKDSTRCFWDIGADLPNKIDGMFCGYMSRMTRQKFRSIYGNELEAKIQNSKGSLTQKQDEIGLSVDNQSSDNPFTWEDVNGITILDYYLRKFRSTTIYKLSNGREVEQEELDDMIRRTKEQEKEMRFMMQGAQMEGVEMGDVVPPEDDAEAELMTIYDEGQPIRIENSKKVKRSYIMHYRIAGDYVIDEEEFPSSDLPMPFVDQNSYYDKSGKQICRPFVIDAVDAQRYLNYLGTQAAYLVKISRFDQFIGSKKNVQSLDAQRDWKDPTIVKGMLVYDESPSGAKPEQLRPAEISPSLIQQFQQTIDGMYTSTGLYPTRMGAQGNEISGAAIDARTRQGSYATYVAFNSINMAITAGGTVVNQMIPRVYDTERVISLMTPDKGRQNITLNQPMDAYGEKIKNDITKGQFEVRLQAGPSYEGQKAQALESLNMILSANPQLLNVVADLYAENLPLMNTTEIRNRLKTLVPPEILEAGKTGEMPQERQQPNAQDQAIMAEVQYKQQQIEIEKQKLQIAMQEQQMKVQTTMMELEMKKLELAAELEEQKLRYLAETDRTRSDNAISHADNITKLLISKSKEPHESHIKY